MTPPRSLPEDAYRFRRLLIDRMWDDERRFGYVDKDTFVGSCPVCDLAVVVRFSGHAARAVLDCHGGCTEAEIAAALGLEVAP
ncbi:MAG: hypothetical protein ACRDLV_05435 [Solirubrobacteraceae bacterium]